MNESERQYWLGHIDGKKQALADLLSWHDGLAEMVASVKAHAAENYTKGWDLIVESFEDSEIAIRIVGSRDLAEALAKFSVDIDVYQDRCADARNSAF